MALSLHSISPLDLSETWSIEISCYGKNFGGLQNLSAPFLILEITDPNDVNSVSIYTLPGEEQKMMNIPLDSLSSVNSKALEVKFHGIEHFPKEWRVWFLNHRVGESIEVKSHETILITDAETKAKNAKVKSILKEKGREFFEIQIQMGASMERIEGY